MSSTVQFLSSIVDEVEVVSTMVDMAAASTMVDRVAVSTMVDMVASSTMVDMAALSTMVDMAALSTNLMVNEILRPADRPKLACSGCIVDYVRCSVYDTLWSSGIDKSLRFFCYYRTDSNSRLGVY